MIRIRNVVKRFDHGFTALHDIGLDIADGELFVLLGRSGCGKTTLLKTLNRLEAIDAGEIKINGNSIHSIDPIHLRRHTGYVIQDIGLLPHLNIAANIALVPQLLKWNKDKIKKAVEEVLDILRLPLSMLQRYPHQLSGGQKQRIGVARAIVANPSILLMDEPFGALDPITREELQLELLRMQSEIRKTIVFVTHDVFEAVTLGDKITIMDQGRIIQSGTPVEVIQSPVNPFVESFFGKHKESLLAIMNRS